MTATLESDSQTSEPCPEPKAPNTLVIVDASNIALSRRDRNGKGSFRTLAHVIDQVIEARLAHAIIADASLRHRIDEPVAYEALVHSGSILQAPAGASADRFIVLLARKRESEGQRVLILTNDRLANESAAGLERIRFLAVSEHETLFDPSLEQVGERHQLVSPASILEPSGPDN